MTEVMKVNWRQNRKNDTRKEKDTGTKSIIIIVITISVIQRARRSVIVVHLFKDHLEGDLTSPFEGKKKTPL